MSGITFDGMKKFNKIMEKLSFKEQKKIYRKANNKAMTPVIKRARSNLKAMNINDSGAMSKSLGKKTKIYAKSQVVNTTAGPRASFTMEVVRKQQVAPGVWRKRRMKARPANYIHLIERGHKIVAPRSLKSRDKKNGMGVAKVKGTGETIGFNKARPFLEPAIEASTAKIKAILAHELKKGLEDAFTKAGKKK